MDKRNSRLTVQGIGLLVELDGFIVGDLDRFRPGNLNIGDEPLLFSPGWLHQYNPDALASGAIVSLRPELPLPGDLPDPVQDPLNTAASERR